MQEERLKALLPDHIRAVFFEEADSTNSIAKQLAASGAPEGVVVIAARQTAGRGRLGRSFSSPPGGIYMSMITRPNAAASDCTPLTMAACVGTRRALASIGVEAGIKWVNDLIYCGRKIAGILVEGAVGADGRLLYAVTGVGLNYRTPSFEGGLSDIAGSLFPNGEPPVPIEEMAVRMMREIYGCLKAPFDGAVYEEYRAASLALGRRVRILRGGGEEALACGVTPSGALVLRHDDGRVEELSSGEVSISL